MGLLGLRRGKEHRLLVEARRDLVSDRGVELRQLGPMHRLPVVMGSVVAQVARE